MRRALSPLALAALFLAALGAGAFFADPIGLAAEAGTRLVVEATGPDAREALEAIGSLFERRFNEHEDNPRS